MNAYRIKKYIGAYAAAMNGVDALIFTAGIGENSEVIRSLVCNDMDFLGIEPRELLRTGEVEYKELNLKDRTLDNSKIIKLMSENPKLIERPIVVSSNQAIIGRPPENVLNLIN